MLFVNGIAFVFINYEQAARCGHLGWGFMTEIPDTFYFGSTDHLLRTPYWDLISLARYMHAAPDSPTDWWSRTGSRNEMLQDMKTGRHVQYHAYKELPLSEANAALARTTAEATGRSGWAVLANNCLHQTHRVLQSYGAGAALPNPRSPIIHRVPRKWFDRIESERHWL